VETGPGEKSGVCQLIQITVDRGTIGQVVGRRERLKECALQKKGFCGREGEMWKNFRSYPRRPGSFQVM